MKPHSCYNRAPFKPEFVAFDGYTDDTRTQVKTVRIKHVMTTDCQHSIVTPTDPRCAGCVRHGGAK